MTKKKPNDRIIYWLPDEEYEKAVGQLRLQILGVFEPFHQYGQDAYIPGAVKAIVKLCEDFGLRIRGADKIISLEAVKKELHSK